MDKAMLIELVGYLGSALVVVSMLMSSVIKLRIINTVGSAIFTVYALVIQSYPTAFMNFCLIVINVYNLTKLMRVNREYDLVESRRDDAFVGYFLRRYMEDIRVYFPDFSAEGHNWDVVYLVFCSSNPAGILLGSRREEGGVEVALEYSTPIYRDCSVGRFLYAELKKLNFRRLSYRGRGEVHGAYLLKMGYEIRDGVYVKQLG